jgi:hypothetical protein
MRRLNVLKGSGPHGYQRAPLKVIEREIRFRKGGHPRLVGFPVQQRRQAPSLDLRRNRDRQQVENGRNDVDAADLFIDQTVPRRPVRRLDDQGTCRVAS